jgi:phenylacetic acid degradation operon negative regulatory protein
VNPSPKSLIVDLLSTLPRTRRGSMPVRALVAAGQQFGIQENSTRVALTRLHTAGTVDRDERGRYRLGERTEAIRREVSSWKTRHRDLRSWDDRHWIGVVAHSSASPAHSGRARQRRRENANRERALRLLGFRPLDPGLYVRPDNLAGGVARTRERLVGLDPSLEAPGIVVAGLSELDVETERRALALWDSHEAIRAYQNSLASLRDSEARLHELSTEEAMVESFLVGGEILRHIALDPLLPEEIVPAADRAALVRAMRHYDELGRACWAGFLESFDVPHMRTPSDLRVADATLSTTHP